MATILSLDVAVKSFADKIGLSVELVCQRLAEDIWNRITLRTPVDTGRARSSWIMSLGEPKAFMAQPKQPSTGKYSQQSTPPPDPAAPFPTDVDIDGTQPIYITSAVLYIEYLEGGSSQQAPNGMVALTLIEVQAEMQKTLEEIAKKIE